MFRFLIVVMSILALVLCVSILLQSGKGGGLAASFGGASSSTESFMGGRQAATALTKITWAGGGLFLVLALVLAVLSSRGTGAPESILRQGLNPSSQAPQSPASVLESEPVPAETTGTAGESGGETGVQETEQGQSQGGGEGE